jgi:predicted alpha/beta-fold hydrolase
MAYSLYFLLVALIYSCIYYQKHVHKSRIYTRNPIIAKIQSKMVYPHFLIPFGMFQSLMQLFRRIKIPKNTSLKSIILEIGDEADLIIEMYEPIDIAETTPFSIKKILQKVFELIKRKKKMLQRKILELLNIKYENRIITALSKYLVHMKANAVEVEDLKEKNKRKITKKGNTCANHSDDSQTYASSFNKINNEPFDYSTETKSYLESEIPLDFNAMDNDIKRSTSSANDNMRGINLSNIPISMNNVDQDTDKNHKRHNLLYERDKDTHKQSNPLKKRESQAKDNVLLVHGLNGSSSSTYIIGMANVFLKRGCRVFCYNSRGAKSPPKSNIFSHVGLSSDIKHTLDYILENYEGNVSLVGFSLGSNWVTKVLGEFTHSRIKMGVAICCPFDFNLLNKTLSEGIASKIVKFVMLNNYKRYVLKSIKDKLNFSSCSTVEEVDSIILKMVGIDNLEAFYKESSCVNYIDQIDKPFLFINTLDDPVVPSKIIPFDRCISNPNVGLILLKGGHLGFFINRQVTMAEILAGEFYDKVSQMRCT